VPSTAATQPLGYVFNTGTQDVTVFNIAARRVVESKPLGAAIQWLSNEQRFWDGQFIWTYDYPQNEVQAIAIDPQSLTIARTIKTGGRGPAHSLMLTPDRRSAWVNVAGEDFLAVLDVASGQMVAQVKTGKFP
jgi:DNA-binding beta-propeller fold protein YncE